MKTTKIVICMVLVSNILFSAEDVKVEEIKIPKKTPYLFSYKTNMFQFTL